MSFFNEERDFTTEKNGPLRLVRDVFRQWKLVSDDGAEQSGPYLRSMWKHILRHPAVRAIQPHSFLILGVGLGNILTLIPKSSHVVAVDWDVDLLEVTKSHFIKQYPSDTEFLVGDAADVIAHIDETFDFIPIDLFSGFHVADLVAQTGFQQNVLARLSKNGIVAVNVFDQPQMLDGWRAIFQEIGVVRYQYNTLGIYQRRG